MTIKTFIYHKNMEGHLSYGTKFIVKRGPKYKQNQTKEDKTENGYVHARLYHSIYI